MGRVRRFGFAVSTGLALVLGVALTVQLTGASRSPAAGRGAHLSTFFGDLGKGKDLAVGVTEAGSAAVLKVLQCDDIFYREYQFPHGPLRVYVAYWAPNKIPTQLVASHTPDYCWSAAGWTCDEMRFKETPLLGARLLPAEWRLFRPPTAGGHPQYVLYWHIVGGKPYDYGRSFNLILNPFRWWRDYVVHATVGDGEQYFARLSSDVPIQSLRDDPGFDTLINRLAALGFAAK
jgi:hypothetical protein